MITKLTMEQLTDLCSRITPTVVALEIIRMVKETIKVKGLIPVYLNDHSNVVMYIIA